MARYWVSLLFPLCACAGDLELSWTGEPPFRVIAERVDSACNVKPVFDFNTLNKREVVQVDFRYCTQYRVCNDGGCAELSRRTFANGQPVICKSCLLSK